MRLGIVGHAQDKFTPETEDLARSTIFDLIDEFSPDVIVSGHSPLGGVDIYAEEIADALGMEKDIKAPKTKHWATGYKPRNLEIAHSSDLVIVIVVRDYPASYTGRRFKSCYHCDKYGSHPAHVKSGGCWTAWQAPRRQWRIL